MNGEHWVRVDGDGSATAPDGPILVVGTCKGLWLLGADANRSAWVAAGPAFLGHVVQHAVLDPRDRRTLLVATRTGHLGPTVFRSTDLGRSFTEASRPPAFATGDPLERALRAVFWLTPGHAEEPGVWYAGGSPQGLFRTEDGGDTWAPVAGWNDHPRWADWAEWPEEGTPDGSMLHSVNVDPRDPRHLYLGLSGGGVFESVDAGSDWAPLNAGSVATFMPDPEPEYGHDPHCVRLHPLRPDRIYQQNHCGIYRMERAEGRWVRIGDNMPRDVGDIGFPIELHPRDPDTAWVFPMDGTDVWPRTSPDGRPAVYVTRDAGDSWSRLDRGLPSRGWLTVKRQAMTVDASDPVGVYFGTTGGEVWASRDEGTSWDCVMRHLPEVYTVEHADPVERALKAGRPTVKVRIPTPLRSYTGDRSVVDATGATVGEVLENLDRQYPGIRFRMVDEQGRVRPHMKVFVGDESVRDLDVRVTEAHELTIMQALSGG